MSGVRWISAEVFILLAPGPAPAGDIPLPHLEADRVALDSDLVLKTYVWAYGAERIDAAAILTRNSEDITPPPAATPTPDQRKAVEGIAKDLRAHPKLVIHADDIAFEPSPGHPGAFDVTNRLFVDTARYYFDNSRYHYVYVNAAGLRTWAPPSLALGAALARDVANYEHFQMDIAARVVRADPARSTLELAIVRVDLKSAAGKLLWSRPMAGAAAR